MSLPLNRNSSVEDIVLFLNENSFSHLVSVFEDNKIDGQDIYDMELVDINMFIPIFKERKKFIALWTSVTGMEFDSSGIKVPTGIASNGQGVVGYSKVAGTPFKEIAETSPCVKATLNSSNSSPHSWIKDFKIPSRWEPNVENALKHGKLTAEQKSALNRQLCMSITAQHTAPVTAAERNHIAMLLIQQYPCLSGSFGSGHQFWAKKIKDRLLNVGRKSARDNKKNVEAAGLVYEKKKAGRKRKILESSEIVPPIPEGESEHTMNEQHAQLMAFCKSNKQDVMLVRQLMDGTFPKRRKTIIEENERVWKILKDYPPFAKGKGIEIKAELGRILQRERVSQEMKEAFEMIRPRLLATLKRNSKKEIQSLFLELDECDATQITELENRCLIAALPFVLGEKKNASTSVGDLFWKIVDTEEGETNMMKEIEKSSTPRLVSSGTALNVEALCLAAEGMVVCKFGPTNAILNAVVTLLASYYDFNASYPSGLYKNVYIFLEHVLLSKPPSSMPIAVDNFLSEINQ